MKDRPQIVLESVLRLLKPLARLLLANGVTYPAFVAALKRVFLEAADDELRSRNMPITDSARTLLSGVHRRDVRTLLRSQASTAKPTAKAAGASERASLSLASEVVTRWLHDARFKSARGRARTLARGSEADSFDSLVAGISSDVRPRAVLDELKRLGAATEDEDGVRLLAGSFAPRQGFEELSWLFADNLHDHLAAAAANLQGQANFLEQSVFVDEITEASAVQLQEAAVLAWKQAFKTVMDKAQARFDHDAQAAEPAARLHRARFGVYFFSDREA
jgi:Family of unknown function (DUF6502)